MKRIIFILLNGFSLVFSQSFALTPERENECRNLVLQIHPTIPGWCSKAKCLAMMELIFAVKPNVCVEIGVFGGKSLFPTAMALKFLERGIVYGVDPWDVQECIRYYPEGPNKEWWSRMDMNAMYHSTIQIIQTYQLDKNCILFRRTSESAAPFIFMIDILHVDGSHCDEEDLIHLSHYLPKVKVGGYIWFDGWSTSPKAYEYVKETCYIRKIVDSGNCILLEKVRAE